jgi:hypothetical protein
MLLRLPSSGGPWPTASYLWGAPTPLYFGLWSIVPNLYYGISILLLCNQGPA